MVLGDCEKLDGLYTLMALNEGNRFDVCYTDPPYLLGKRVVRDHSSLIMGGEYRSTGFGTDAKIDSKRKVSFDDTKCDVELCYSNFSAVSKHNMVWGGNYFQFLPVSKGWIVWNKHVSGFQGSEAELMWTDFRKSRLRIFDWTWNGCVREGNKRAELKSRIHPTQKPVGLTVNILDEYVPEAGTVLDPFLGSGSTLIACEESGRICFGMEIEPYYIGMAVRRWEEYTGLKASRLR